MLLPSLTIDQHKRMSCYDPKPIIGIKMFHVFLMLMNEPGIVYCRYFDCACDNCIQRMYFKCKRIAQCGAWNRRDMHRNPRGTTKKTKNKRSKSVRKSTKKKASRPCNGSTRRRSSSASRQSSINVNGKPQRRYPKRTKR